jgi:hypothetical protein
MRYRIISYNIGPEGLEGMEALANEWAEKGYRLLQIIKNNAYEREMTFEKVDAQAKAS